MAKGDACGTCRKWRAWSQAHPYGYGDCEERSNPMPGEDGDRLKHYESRDAEECPKYDRTKEREAGHAEG